MKILIVEDEPELLNHLRQTLMEQRYTVDTAADGERAIDLIFENTYDLILLDILLPKINGFTILSEIRKAHINTPVLMLTARAEESDKIRGLDIGADDYLVKPFSMAELLARIRALLRRAGDNAESKLRSGSIELDTRTREVRIAGNPLALTLKEFSILEFLMYNKNRAVSRFNLAEHVWGDDFDPFTMSNFIDVHIKNLRRKIDEAGDGCPMIQTVRGVGYMIKDEQN